MEIDFIFLLNFEMLNWGHGCGVTKGTGGIRNLLIFPLLMDGLDDWSLSDEGLESSVIPKLAKSCLRRTSEYDGLLDDFFRACFV